MKKIWALLLALALMAALTPAALADGETVNITTAAELMDAIANQKDGQTWNIAAGTYDISRNTTITAGGKTGWYFPVVETAITIKGAGIDQTTITSSVVSANGDWQSQDFMSIWSDGVTIQDLTIRPKLDTNKAIEIMGKDVTLKNIEILHNNIVTHESYLTQKGIVADSDTDYYDFFTKEFAGSIYFNIADIGNALFDNVLITQAWISCRTDTVSAGTLTLTGCTTIDFRGAGYGVGAGIVSNNTNEGVAIIADDFHILYDEGTALENVYMPEGTRLFDPHTSECEPEVLPEPTPTPKPREKYYQIDIITGAGGTSNPITPTFALEGGDSLAIEFIPKAGYVLYDVKVDGKSVGPVKSYTFTKVTADHKIEAVFIEEGAQRPPQTGSNGTLAGYVMLALAFAAAAVLGLRRARAR